MTESEKNYLMSAFNMRLWQMAGYDMSSSALDIAEDALKAAIRDLDAKISYENGRKK